MSSGRVFVTLSVLLTGAIAVSPDRTHAQDDSGRSNVAPAAEEGSVSRGVVAPSRNRVDLGAGRASAAGAARVAAFPDVCLTPAPPAPALAIPYPNIGANVSALEEGAHKVKGGGEIVVRKTSGRAASTGSEPAASGGVVSAAFMGPVAFRMASMAVKVEGRNVVRVLDMTSHNAVVSRGAAPSAEEGRIVELEDGRVCGVCMRNGAITAIYELERTPARR